MVLGEVDEKVETKGPISWMRRLMLRGPLTFALYVFRGSQGIRGDPDISIISLRSSSEGDSGRGHVGDELPPWTKTLQVPGASGPCLRSEPAHTGVTDLKMQLQS